MAFGIDTFQAHLDRLPAISAGGDFFVWNGGAAPAFAGRNFLFGQPSGDGDFLWGHAEATDASSEKADHTPGPNDPSPQHPEHLTVTVPLIAPIQAPQPPRQQMTGERGLLLGQLDAHAICDRVFASIAMGEFELQLSQIVHIWLAVDSTANLSPDYWAGWSDGVNRYSTFWPVIGGIGVTLLHFQACVLCSYIPGPNGLLRPDPHVTGALASHLHPALNTNAHAFWADASVGAHPDQALPSNPPLDWSVFDPATMPSLWRLKNGFLKANGQRADVTLDVDAVNTGGSVKNATAFMLTPQTWQPNVVSIVHVGFSQSGAIQKTHIDCMQRTPLPDMWELADEAHPTQRETDHHVQVGGGRVATVGRYLRDPLNADEVKRLSDAGFDIFTTWQRGVHGPTNIDYFTVEQGQEDGKLAFAFCDNVLKQPPHTPVFFAVDFDAADPHEPPQGGGPHAKDRISAYFREVKKQRDAYAQVNPDRFYLIGVYGSGGLLSWCYEEGIVTMFWQSVSFGSTGNQYGHRPWFHANRWQYQGTFTFTDKDNKEQKHVPPGGWTCVPGFDPDADWGDGGSWNLRDPLAQRLLELEKREAAALEQELRQFWNGLLHPGQLHP